MHAGKKETTLKRSVQKKVFKLHANNPQGSKINISAFAVRSRKMVSSF